jgi:hypothetical protein
MILALEMIIIGFCPDSLHGPEQIPKIENTGYDGP